MFANTTKWRQKARTGKDIVSHCARRLCKRCGRPAYGADVEEGAELVRGENKTGRDTGLGGDNDNSARDDERLRKGQTQTRR